MPSQLVSACLLWCCVGATHSQYLDVVGNHPAVRDREGRLVSWADPREIVRNEMEFYAKAPVMDGYATFVSHTFLDGSLKPTRGDSIPAMQCATGIESYLAYDRFTGKTDPRWVKRAREFADYILDQCLTPKGAEWPVFPRSTGKGGATPQQPDCGSQSDHPYEIQPDKGGLFGYALVDLYARTKDARYLGEALSIARTLAKHQADGSPTSSPFPFQVDYRDGASRVPVSANMAAILRLYDDLESLGHSEFDAPKHRLWKWIKTDQVPSADLLHDGDGSLWLNFFEDHDEDANRNSWSVLQLVSFLCDRRESIDPEWKKDSQTLMDFVNFSFVSVIYGTAVCGEQTNDKQPWGGVMGNYVGTLAKYVKATGDRRQAWVVKPALAFILYAVNSDGCPRENALRPGRGGWQEDCHTDVIHGIMDAFAADPSLQRR